MSLTTSRLAEWFRGRAAVGSNEDVPLDRNYFEEGWVDSLGVIELIEHVEGTFGVRFAERHFQDRRFATIAGLAEIVDELSGARRDDATLPPS